MLAEHLADDPFPGIELEQRFDAQVVEVAEASSVPADVFHCDARGVETRLDRRIAKIVDRAAVLCIALDGGEGHPRAPEPELFPGFDQLLVDGIGAVAP